MAESVDVTAPDPQPSQSALWRNHDFVILWSGETVSQLGSSMSFFLFPIVGYAITGSTALAALAGTAFTLGSVLVSLPAGVWVDRWSRRTTMQLSNLAGAFFYATLVVAMVLDHLTLAHLIVAAFLTGVVGRFFGPAETAAIRTVVPTDQLATAFSQNEARQHLANLIGPPVAGALYAVVRWVPFLGDAVSYLVSAAAVGRIRSPLPAPPRSEQSVSGMRADIAEGLRFLWNSMVLRAIVLFACIVNFAALALFIALTLKLLRAGVQPAAIGLIDTIGAVAGIGGSIVAPAIIKRVPTGPLSIAVAVVVSVAVVPMAFTNNVVYVGLLVAGALFLLPAGNASILAYLVAITPDRLQGRVQSALGFSASALQPAGPIVGGGLLALFGGEPAMIAMAVVICLSGLPLFLSRDIRHLGTPDTWPDVAADQPVPEIIDDQAGVAVAMAPPGGERGAGDA